jgi:hypothetical protein
VSARYYAFRLPVIPRFSSSRPTAARRRAVPCRADTCTGVPLHAFQEVDEEEEEILLHYGFFLMTSLLVLGVRLSSIGDRRVSPHGYPWPYCAGPPAALLVWSAVAVSRWLCLGEEALHLRARGRRPSADRRVLRPRAQSAVWPLSRDPKRYASARGPTSRWSGSDSLVVTQSGSTR